MAKKVCFYSNTCMKILHDYNVERCEIDIQPQGVDIPSKIDMNTSMYYPYTFISSGRQCPIRDSTVARPLNLSNLCTHMCERVILVDKCISKTYRKGDTVYKWSYVKI